MRSGPPTEIGYVLDDLFAQHVAPAGHPERAQRVIEAAQALRLAGVERDGVRIPLRAATPAELAAVHTQGYLASLAAKLPGQSGWLDPDTYFAPVTWDAARAAAGTLAELTIQVWEGRLARGLAVVRPPGHHATSERAMGFCILNNVAVAARAVQARGARRVAIIDWDVHHGNGTQDIFWNDPSVLYVSIHQFPYYPGSGAPHEIGGPLASGRTLNIGLPEGSGDLDYVATVQHVCAPAIAEFAPDVILVSAGFDAHEHDPIASMRVTAAGFAAMAQALLDVARTACEGRIVFALEGGYDVAGLAASLVEVWHTLVTPGRGGALVTGLPFAGDVRGAMAATALAHANGAAWAKALVAALALEPVP